MQAPRDVRRLRPRRLERLDRRAGSIMTTLALDNLEIMRTALVNLLTRT